MAKIARGRPHRSKSTFFRKPLLDPAKAQQACLAPTLTVRCAYTFSQSLQGRAPEPEHGRAPCIYPLA